MFETESIPNIMPLGHAANAIALPDDRLLLTWYCGSYEGGEDQRIAMTVRRRDSTWEPSRALVRRFDYQGDQWVPEIGVPAIGPGGDLRLYFWACPLSTFRLCPNRGQIRLSGGTGGGSFMPFPIVPFESPVWARDISTSQLFQAPLSPDFTLGTIRPLWEERGLVIMGTLRRLQSGRYVLPYHTERKEAWFHSRFLVSDTRMESWESRGDSHASPGCLEPGIVQLPSGRIVCYMRHGGFDGHIWRSVSDDECLNFSPPERTNLRNPHAGTDVALSSTSGRLLVAFNDSYQLRVPLSVGISHDEGATFCVRDVEAKLGSFAYPKLLQTRDGIWHLFYSWNYLNIQHAWFDENWLEGGRQTIG